MNLIQIQIITDNYTSYLMISFDKLLVNWYLNWTNIVYRNNLR